MRRFLLPAVTTCLLFATLMSLGIWQCRRLAWKEAILRQIAAAEAAPPVALGQTIPADYSKISAHGTWRAGAYALYGAKVDGAPGHETLGADLLQILDRPGLPPVLIDRGWIPTDRAPQPAMGEADIIGYSRPRDTAGLLSAQDDPARHRYYTLDPAKIGHDLAAADTVNAYTVISLAATACHESACPIAAPALPRPMNNHLQYAVTWFALAGAVLCIFALWTRDQIKNFKNK